MARFDDLADRLDAIAEELGDLALDHLREALGADDDATVDAAKADERRLTRARRRIVEAAELLRR